MEYKKKKIPLSECCEAIVDCEHKTAPTQAWGIPCIRTTNIKNGRLDLGNANRVSEEIYKKWTTRLEPKPSDLILAREAPVGEVGIIPTRKKVCLGQRTVLIRTNEEKVHSRYLLYLLITPQIRHEMLSRSEGSTVPHLNMSDIRNLEIPYPPPLPEQKAIAQILGSLDDKIELNRQMNQTLEKIAWTIFKSWFKEDSFPDDWQFIPLEDCMAEIIDYRGKTPKKTSFGIPLITAKIVKDGRIKEPKEFIAPEDYDSWMRRGIPECGDVVMTTEAPLGEIAQLNGLKVALAQRLITLRGKLEVLDNTYLKFLMQSYFVQVQINSRATGTTVLGIRQSELRKINLVIPPISEQEKISLHLRIIEDKIGANEEQSLTLASIRDTLLPKLLSGKIRVKEAEKLVEEVV